MKCPMMMKKEDQSMDQSSSTETDTCPNGVCPMRKKDQSMDQSISTETETITCPNSDPEFNKIIGTNKTPEERSNLFIICVIVRALLYTGVYVYRDAPWMPYVVGILAAISALQLSRPTKNKQWWSKKFQFVMAILVLFSAIAVKFANFDSRSMSVLLFISLFGGIYQRTQTTLC